MSRKSLSIKKKLDMALHTPVVPSVQSECSFASKQQFTSHIAEGALLNISKIASKALSIPCGEYMVWLTDVGHTMLVPVGQTKSNTEVFEGQQDQYEVVTSDLISNWDKVGILSEEAKPPEEHKFEPDTSKYERKAMYRAMENHGYHENFGALADEVGVDTPMISRILTGDRDPSLGLAAKLCKALSSGPSALFPDVFGPQVGDHLEPKDVKANRGSGMKGAAKGSRSKGKASKKWTQGGKSSSESFPSTDQIIVELDSQLNAPINQASPGGDKSSMQELPDSNNQELEDNIEQVEDDIDQLTQGLDQGVNHSVSGTDQLKSMRNQVGDIKDIIGKISAGI